MTKEIIATPQKAKYRNKVVGYATLYCIHMADLYIQGAASGESNDLKKFLYWLDKRFWESKRDMELRTNWDVNFKEDDVYKIDGMLKVIRKNEAIGGLEGIAKFIYSMVALFWQKIDKGENMGRNSLTDFTTIFLPKYAKSVQFKPETKILH